MAVARKVKIVEHATAGHANVFNYDYSQNILVLSGALSHRIVRKLCNNIIKSGSALE